jgi:hypothetical protein
MPRCSSATVPDPKPVPEGVVVRLAEPLEIPSAAEAHLVEYVVGQTL